MGWIDGLIEAVSPRWAAQRQAWRQSLSELKNYDAGSDHRLNAGWRATNQSAEETDRWSRDMVRARARDLERNSDIMASILGAIKRNVIGNGFQLQAMTGSERLNSEIERLWKIWCRAENCDVTGQQTFTQILRMIIVRKKVDGGVLIVKRIVDDAEIPLQLQIFEVDELDSGYTKPTRTENKVIGGVEYNSYNRPVGYWIKQYSIDGFTAIEPVYIPAEDVIFFYTKKRPSQIREISDMAPTLTRIRDINEFITSVSVKQRVLACLSVFIKKEYPTSGIGGNGDSFVFSFVSTRVLGCSPGVYGSSEAYLLLKNLLINVLSVYPFSERISTLLACPVSPSLRAKAAMSSATSVRATSV